jgi:hypothetical protein
VNLPFAYYSSGVKKRCTGCSAESSCRPRRMHANRVEATNMALCYLNNLLTRPNINTIPKQIVLNTNVQAPRTAFTRIFLHQCLIFFFSRAPPLQAYKTSSIFGGGRHCQNDSSGSFEWRMRNHMIVVVDRLFMCVPYITTSIVITTSGLLDIFAYKMAAQR